MIMVGQIYESTKHGWKAKVIGKNKDMWVLRMLDSFDSYTHDIQPVRETAFIRNIEEGTAVLIEEGTAVLIEESPNAPVPVLNRLDGVD